MQQLIAIRRGIFRTKVALLTFVVLFLLACVAGSAFGITYNVTHSKIDNTADSHGTTRTTVRHVFHYDGQWYVFCGDHREKTYYAFFVTSTDGINWSKRKVGTGDGVTSDKYGSPDYHESPLVVGNKVYITKNDSGTNNLMIRSGTIANGNITWSAPSIVARGKLSPRESFGYYPDTMIEEDGHLSFTCRHYYVDELSRPHLDPAFVVTTKPGDITDWQEPLNLITLPEPQMIDGHENIPLSERRRVLIYRTHNKVYKAGTPGNFYAFHWNGAEWSKPVDLGNSDGINGSDKRFCAMLDPVTGTVHLTYIEDSGTLWKNELRHRTLSPPYGVSDWSSPATIAENVFTTTMGMDTSSKPARIAVICGDQKYTPGGQWGGRLHTGELYMKWFDGKSWQSGRQLISEPGDERAWYPSISQDVSGTFGVLYTRGQPNGKNFELRFSLIEPGSKISSRK
ncbi:MAG: hypothetical protein GY774_09410 [Planctomycetes bacterium]|nr:hypothetical protein [Planctomycetota bacterium]